MTTHYKLHSNDHTLSQGPAAWRFKDIEDEDDKLQIDAFVASGDYFEMLVNELDQLLPILDPNSAEHFRLQRLIDNLFYLRDNYKIVRKDT